MTLRICHLSDTHGHLPDLPDPSTYDVLVHSGDFCPNRTFGNRPVEETYQDYWMQEKGNRLREWVGEKPILVIPGNHDYINIAYRLVRYAGVNAIDLEDKFVEYEGVGFYGYPWVPEFLNWNYMASPRERRQRLMPAVELMEQGAIDVFVAHGPMHGVLDRNAEGIRCGSRVMRQTMQTVRHPPKLFLHGHIHEAAGVQGWTNGVIVSNAACTVRVLTLY